ncbi:MAG: transposase [Bacteroidetes bacterium]|nr:MAG: transposase [Bacteroidota bacterium]
MQFVKGYLYHIYNQGNNKQTIFFKKENYLFFLRKIRTYILPYADIISWCLMPNHFHLMVLINETELAVKTVGVAPSHTDSNADNIKKQTINESIGIMLRSYSQAINKQNNTTGKLIREKTKAECINCPNGITPSFISKNSITQININKPERQYPQICFDYIHQNPVKSGLAKSIIDWEFSSAIDFTNIRNGKLINMEVAKEYIEY